jgi:hypothetical protein
VQPISEATARCANDFRFSSHSCHLRVCRPIPKVNLSTGLLCHATSTGSGTSPNIFLLNFFTIAP